MNLPTIAPPLTKTAHRKKIRLGLSFLILLVSWGGTSTYNRSRAISPLRLEDLAPLPVEQAHRLLIVAPHPDDEILGSGGLIQEALRTGKTVRVVVITNGDGQILTPGLLHHGLLPQPENYIALGKLRQAETLAALKEVGLGPKKVFFLGYSDRSLAPLWTDNWNTDCPKKTNYTRSTRSPYSITYRPEAWYCGSDILADLEQIVLDFKPDLVVVPHPNDEHPDHQAASNFVRMAIATLAQKDPNFNPTTWGYLVHYGSYPYASSSQADPDLLPPAPLSGESTQWARLDLSASQKQRKSKAVHCYRTQLKWMGSFLKDFVRNNEIFVRLEDIHLAGLHFGDLELTESEAIESIQIGEPSRESMRRAVAAGTDLTGWKLARMGDTVFLTADLRGRLIPGIQYRILVKTIGGETLTYGLKSQSTSLAPSSFTAQIRLAEIGHPVVLGFAAEVRQGAVLDRTGWTIARLDY